MALKLFGGGKPDHPLADEKGAKETLATLPANDPFKCIEEIRHWIESTLATEGFKPDRRAEIVLLLDETAQAHHRKLQRDYLANPNLPKFQEQRLWSALFGLWKDLARAYVTCLGQLATDPGKLKPQMPLVTVRAVRAIAAQMKWHFMHYEPAEAGTWGNLSKVYRFAEERKLAKEAAAVYPGVPVNSTAEREFMKALMLAASSPDCLRTVDIELAERLVAHLSGSFLISNAHVPQQTYYWIDLAADMPPKRLTQQPPPPAPTQRFFAAGAALAQLDQIIKMVESGAVPSDLNLGGTYEPEKLLGVLRHLKMYWATTPPVRKHDRYSVQHKINVVNGFKGVLGKLQGGANGAESWAIDNISAGGIGAAVEKQADWLRIGKLVGVQVEGGSGSLSVGIVRRCNKLTKQQSSVGLQTFAKETYAVQLGGADARDALLLNDGKALKEEVLLCMQEGGFNRRVSPSLTFEQQSYLLIPNELVESGEEFELARYRVMQQS
jgi:hypothetical protein